MKVTSRTFSVVAALFLSGWVGVRGASACISDHGTVAAVAFPVFGGHVTALNADGDRMVIVPVWTGWNESGERSSSFLSVNVENGEAMMTEPVFGDTAYGSFLSADNLLYFMQKGYLLTFDVKKGTVRKLGEVPHRMPLGFTCDPQGRIFFSSYPNAELLCYDPAHDRLTNYGPVAKESWPQYPQIAVDDQGWVYITIRHKAANLIGFHPETGERREYLAPEERIPINKVWHYRATDGAAYIKLDSDGKWRRLHAGEMTLVQRPNPDRAVWRNATREPNQYPDGSRVSSVQISNRNLKVHELDGTDRLVKFDYDVNGARIYSLTSVSNQVYGATGLPPRLFHFDPETEQMQDTKISGVLHMNAWTAQNGKLYGGGYSNGHLYEYDPNAPGADAFRDVYGSEKVRDSLGRPFDLAAHPDGKHILMTGNPARGRAGGGLLVFDTETGKGNLLTHKELVEEQGAKALAILPNGDVFCGTTTSAATGGTRTATEAKLYRLSWPDLQKQGEWAPFADLSAFNDLIVAGNGLVYGLTSGRDLFVWNPETAEMIHSEKLLDYGENTGAPGLQTTNVMALGPDGQVYVLFTGGLVRVDSETFQHEAIYRSSVPLTGSLTRVGRRFFFAAGAHLLSCELNAVHGSRPLTANVEIRRALVER